MHNSLRRLLSTLIIAGIVCGIVYLGGTSRAQEKVKLPARIGYVNDFAGVVDEKTKQRLETILDNVKQRTGIEFDLATVQTTGNQDIFDYSRRLAADWNLGAPNSTKKSLLLVVSVNEQAVFTQLSRSVQRQLPEGILGDMSQRVRSQLTSGQFSQGLTDGVNYFVAALSRKLGFNTEDIDQVLTASVTSPPATDPTPTQQLSTEPTATPQPATDPAATPQPTTDQPATPAATPDPTPVAEVSPSPDAPAPVKTAGVQEESPRVSVERPEESPAVSTRRPEDRNKTERELADEDELEEVELTLTLPLEERVKKLKEFLQEYPKSKAKPRAIELLVSSYAAIGDRKLQDGDNRGGIEQLMLAINEAPVDISDKLFSGVIAQIPLNLYVRGHTVEAVDAARALENKFGADAKRLLTIARFYLRLELGNDATRISTQAVKLAPESAEAHQTLALALHISLRLDEASAEYQRALDLDPNIKGTRRSLADLYRAAGKAEEALNLYRSQLAVEPNDKAARAGVVFSLLELSRTDEAEKELAAALNEDPRNLALLTGAAYWFAAHNNSERALELGRKAVEVEPRYTWSQIALARALIGQKKPLEAERAIRFARQYGKFPTLEYELASALAAAGLYGEAAEVLSQTFSLNDGSIEVRLAGGILARESDFMKLLAAERQAGLFQFAAADNTHNAAMLKALMALVAATTQPNEGKFDEAAAAVAAKEFASGPDEMRVYRQLYAANRLVEKGIALPTAYELTEAARSSVDEALMVPVLTVAVQAEEYRDLRARVLAQGGTPEIAEAPRDVMSNILRGRIEDIAGWALFQQNKTSEALVHLKRAANILPEGTPASRTALWHVGAALVQEDQKEEALAYYIKSYNSGEPDAGRKAVIEQLYQKTYGSLDGLSERGGGQLVAANIAPISIDKPAAGETPSPSPEAVSSPSAPESSASPATPVSPSESQPSPSPERAAATAEATPQTNTSRASSDGFPGTLLPKTVKLTGKIRDANNIPVPNVVVVLISPRGTVLATTTNSEGIYSFVIAPSLQNYRIIPSKDGYTFAPIDKVLPGFTEDQKDIDFIGTSSSSP
ncbi:MAG TPA: TPM domain-containing protein [Pyrinomonadaceae bacterium]|nr:TPM domain-containing protein [Pyrinomonadaceae bacterium]